MLAGRESVKPGTIKNCLR